MGENEKSSLERTPQLLYRLYPERMRQGMNATSSGVVSEKKDVDALFEKTIQRRIGFYDSESKSYK